MKCNENVATFDTPERLNRSEKIADEIKRHFQSGPIDVLEVGCKTGDLSYLLQQRIRRGDLIDESAAMIEAAKKKLVSKGLSHLHPIHTDFLSYDTAERYDVIFSSMLLHHLTDVEPTLIKCRELLKPKGTLVIVDLLPDNGVFHECELDFDGHHGFVPEEFSKILKSVGLTPSIGQKFFSGYVLTKEGQRHPYSLFSISATK